MYISDPLSCIPQAHINRDATIVLTAWQICESRKCVVSRVCHVASPMFCIRHLKNDASIGRRTYADACEHVGVNKRIKIQPRYRGLLPGNASKKNLALFSVPQRLFRAILITAVRLYFFRVCILYFYEAHLKKRSLEK